MAIAIDQTFALANAILKAVGIDPGTVRSVRFEHTAGDMPMLTVELPVFNTDTSEIDIVTQRWVLEESSTTDALNGTSTPTMTGYVATPH